MRVWCKSVTLCCEPRRAKTLLLALLQCYSTLRYVFVCALHATGLIQLETRQRLDGMISPSFPLSAPPPRVRVTFLSLWR